MSCEKPDIVISNRLAAALDVLGYSLQSIKTSQYIAKYVQQMHTFLNNYKVKFQTFVVGSKIEGVSLFDETSDYDYMHVFPSIRCSIASTLDHSHTFKLCMDDTPPGYAMLEILEKFYKDPTTALLCNDTGQDTYLASDSNFDTVLSADILGPSIVHRQEDPMQNAPPFVRAFALKLRHTGPSWEVSSHIFVRQSNDHVGAFPAFARPLTKMWSNRKRHHSFPSQIQIKEISKMDAHVVPVGCKVTEDVVYQWRICFTFAEVALIQSFNGIQFKVYAILKMLSKSALKTVCPGITSYIIKNVVLWVSELNPISLFGEDNISHCLVVCVHFLRQCVKCRCLPNYMIPERNLLFAKLNDKTIRELNCLLGEMISERGLMVLRCKKLKMALKLTVKLPGIVAHINIRGHSLIYVLLRAIFNDNNLLTLLQGNVFTFVRIQIQAIGKYAPLACAETKIIMIMFLKKMKMLISSVEVNPADQQYEAGERQEVLLYCSRTECRVMETLVSDMKQRAKRTVLVKLIDRALMYGDQTRAYLQGAFPVVYRQVDRLIENKTYERNMTLFISYVCSTQAVGSTEQQYDLLYKLFNSWK